MGKILLNIFKFILAVILFPILYSVIQNFRSQLEGYPANFEEFFLWGMGAFIITYLFVYRFEIIYSSGQKIIASIFQFTTPANQFIAQIIPFYTTLIVLLFVIVTALLNVHKFDHYFLFFIGFTAAMHLVLTAHQVYNEENTLFKPSYFFIISIISILYICLLILLFDLSLEKFSFPVFLGKVIDASGKIYLDAIRFISHKF